MSGAPPPVSSEDTPEQTEAPPGAGQQVHTELSLPNFIRLAIINILVLVELCFAMYMAKQEPEEFTPVFFKVFFSLLVPTLILGILSKRFVRRKEKQ